MLEQTLRAVAGERRPSSSRIIGPAGIGKSRLTAEFLARLGDRCPVVAGRCLPYGEGITFWPVVEALKESVQISDRDSPAEARQKLSALLPAGQGQRGHLSIGSRPCLALAPTMPGIQETFWAIRQVFEALAAERPLVVVFDDIQWGESTFLDLLEYLADWIRGSRSCSSALRARSSSTFVRAGRPASQTRR